MRMPDTDAGALTAIPPIGDTELDTIFAGLAAFDVIGVGVSGGSDSLALLHLVARWQRRTRSDAQIIVFTVDHGLRAASADEAAFVARCSATLGLPHETLRWDGEKPTTGLAAAARIARYRLMGDRLAAITSEVSTLVVGHTRDDQGETVLMRLARGSSVAGLAAMRAQRWLTPAQRTMLLRPLLDWSRAQLQATLVASGHTWIDDPTNADRAFERVRVRSALAALSSVGVTSEGLALAASRLARAHDALTEATDALARGAVRHLPDGTIAIERGPFEAAALELRVRLLARLVRSPHLDTPALAQIEHLAHQLAVSRQGEAAPGRGRWTLGGLTITRRTRVIELAPEAARTR